MKLHAYQSIPNAVPEILEGRACLNGTIALHDGVLLIQADPNTASHVQVVLSSDQTRVTAFTENVIKSFPRDQVRSLMMIGSHEADWIYVDPKMGTPAVIQGNGGDDTIKGGSGFDSIDGGSGNDVIHGHGILYAGTGNTTIWGSDAGDVIIGGAGNDLLVGGSGNDTIIGGSGKSTLIGGNGNDKLYAGGGNQMLFGGGGDDTLVGGTGRDFLFDPYGDNTQVIRSASTIVRADRHDQIIYGAGSADWAEPAFEVQHVMQGASNAGNSTSNSGWTAPDFNAQQSAADSGSHTQVQVSVSDGSSSATAAPAPADDGAAPDGTAASFTQFQSTITAGQGVEVNGLSSHLAVGTRLTAQYQWDFGDPAGRYNQLTGWNAGHVYDNPGTYTITLRVTDSSGQVSTRSSTVTVNPDDRRVIYVDTNGSDSNDGSSPDQAVQTAAQAFSLAGDNTIIEFRRGETFQVDQTLMINGHDMAVGAYGQGSNPVLVRGQGDGSVVLFLTGKAANTTIQDLTFDSIYPATDGVAPEIPVVCVWAQGTNLVVRNDTFLNVNDAVNGVLGPSGVIVQDNNAPLVTGIRGYFTYLNGDNWTIVGNQVANSTREHDIRSNSETCDSVLIEDNDLAKINNPQDPAEIMKTTINFRAGNDIFIDHNKLTYGTVSMAHDNHMSTADGINWVMIQNNQFHNAQLHFFDTVHHAMVNNNTFDLTGTAQIYLISGDLSDPNGHLTDITVTQNTGINDGTTGNFFQLQGQAAAGNITLTHNLYVAPNMVWASSLDSAVLVQAPDLSGFADISDNVWPAPATTDAVNYLSASNDGSGYVGSSIWLAQGQVHNDQFESVTLSDGVYQTTLNGITAGASL